MITLNNLRYHKVWSLVDVVKILKILPYMGMAAICCRDSINIFCQTVKNGLHIIIFCDYQSKFDLAAKKSPGSTKGHHLDILGSTQVPEATYKV